MSKYLIIFIVLALSFNGFCFDRVVILSPSAGDIFQKLELENKVVGATKNLKGFDGATAVGTHIKPNIEIIKSLKPDLIIVAKGKYFTDEIKDSLGIETYAYDPKTLAEVIIAIRDLGKMFSKADTADALEKSLRNVLSGIKKPDCTPKVFFEVSQVPLMAAGTDGIVDDIITRAGGQLVLKETKKVFKTNVETVITSKPDIYIYQQGAMNQNPTDPKERMEYRNLSAEYIKVDESDYSRANTSSFENVLILNRAFIRHCASKQQ